MQFINFSFDKVVKNLSNDEFKYLTEEFGSKTLKPFKQRDTQLFEYTDNFKRFNKEKLPDKKCFYSSVKDGTTGDKGKKQMVTQALKIIWHAKKFGKSLT